MTIADNFPTPLSLYPYAYTLEQNRDEKMTYVDVHKIKGNVLN